MELKTFAEDNFDPKEWINKAWSTSGNQEKELFVANTVSRLQLYMKQLTNALDETTTQIVTSIPRILQDASSLQLEAGLLQQKLVSLEEKVEGVEAKTGQSIDSLQRIDQLKSRLENAASALREADKWAALASSLEEVLDTGVPTHSDKLRELADQVTAMTASLEVLSDAPDYETKRLQLETLYNRLEAAVSPALIDALTQMDAERTSTYVSLFRGMSRPLSARRCWRSAAAARLAAAWRRLDLHSLGALTRLLAGEAGKQVDWLTSVLQSDTPLAELVRLYTDLLLSLDPSPSKLVSANLKLCSTPEEGLLLILDLRTEIDQLMSSIQTVVDAPRPNKETLPPAIWKEFGRAAYAPLRELLPKYSDLQTHVLLAHLNDPGLDQTDLLERARVIASLCARSGEWLATARAGARALAGDSYWHVLHAPLHSYISALSQLISSHGGRAESSFASSRSTAGVLSDCFPTALVLETAATALLAVVADLQKDVEEPTSPLSQYLDVARAPQGTLGAALRRASDQLRALARAVLRNPVDVQLDKIPQLSVWNNNDALSTDLPDFALSPQEYITEIGQYLMTLPQHLEMHLSEKQAPLQFLSEVCTHTCEVYAEKILNIRNMDALGTKRCLNDIVYLSSVVEDLGSAITPALKNLEKSLRAATPSQPSE